MKITRPRFRNRGLRNALLLSGTLLWALFGASAFAQTITTMSPLPAGIAGTLYSRTLTASGGTPGYTWSVRSGSTLPPGLTLSAAGLLSGIPTQPGTFTFTLRVMDSKTNPKTDEKLFSLTISPAPAPPSITTTSPLPAGVAGTAYSQTLAASGGTPGYSWSVTAGSLPGGLSLSTAGTLTGTPVTAGSSTFTIQVADSSTPSRTSQKAFTLIINAAPTPPSITTTSPLPAGVAGTAYSQTLVASGGTPGYSWSVTAGSLPGGLSLSTAGTLTGTPATAGSSAFTIQVADSSTPSRTSQKAFSLSINPAAAPPSVITTSPLPPGVAGTFYSQTLAAGGGTPGYTWSLTAGSLPPGLTLSAAGLLTGTPVTAGPFSFTVGIRDSGVPAQTASRTFVLSVDTAPLSSLALTNVPGQVNPTQQVAIGLSASAPMPSSTAGTLRLSFISRAAIPVDDPTVLFSNGSRIVSFTIPANGTAAVFPAPVLVLSGTVGGTIALTAEIPGQTSQLVGAIDVRSLSPQLVNASGVRTAGGVSVSVTGYSPERRVTRAEFAFRVKAGAATTEVRLNRDVENDFAAWYGNPASSRFGSSFVFTQSFSIQGDSSAIESVVVTLTNSQGSSSSGQIVFQN